MIQLLETQMEDLIQIKLRPNINGSLDYKNASEEIIDNIKSISL